MYVFKLVRQIKTPWSWRFVGQELVLYFRLGIFFTGLIPGCSTNGPSHYSPPKVASTRKM